MNVASLTRSRAARPWLGRIALALALAAAAVTAAAQARPRTAAARAAHPPRAAPAAVAPGQPAPPPFAAALAADAAGTPIALPEALAAARDNLEVSIARRSLSAVRADVLAANHAPLPVLSGKVASIDLQNGIGAGNLVTGKRVDQSIGLDWTWERGGKRALRTLNAERNVTAAVADVDDARLQQLLATVAAYWDLASAQRRIEQLDEVERGSAQIADSANRRVKAGDLGRQDALRTEIDVERVRADQTAARLERERAALALAQLTGRMQDAGRLRAVSDWPPPSAAPAPDDPAWPARLNALLEDRPEVRAALARLQAAQAGVDLARSQRTGDVTIGASVDHYPGVSTRSLELRASIPLQWGYRYQGEIGRALALAEQAQDALDRARRDSLADLLRLQREVQSTAARVRAFDRDVLPRAQNVAAGAEFAFGKGAIPLTDLLDARRVLRLTLVDSLVARTEYAKALGAWTLRTQPAAAALSPVR